MARMTVNPPTDLVRKLERLGDRMDDIAPKMLNAGISPLEKEIKKNAQKHTRTGEMAKSVSVKKPKKEKNGVWKQRVTFDGYDKKRKPTKSDPRGVPNARKAMSLEYGTSKESAQPFIRPAVISTESAVTVEMQDVFNQEVERA